MKRNLTNSDNSVRIGNLFRKFIMHIVLLCLMIMLESAIILKLRITPERASRITVLIFLMAAAIPALMPTNKNRFYDKAMYYLGILLIWATIGMGFFDSGIIGLKQLGFSVLASVIMLFAMTAISGRKSANKFKHR